MEANARRERWLALLEQPLRSQRPSGEFSDLEQLRLEFISLLPSKVRPELLVRGAEEKLSNSASQIFAREVRSIEAFADGVATARLPGDQAWSDFGLMHKRYTLVPSFGPGSTTSSHGRYITVTYECTTVANPNVSVEFSFWEYQQRVSHQ